MQDWIPFLLGLAPWIPVLALWTKRYRERRLRVRTMGWTAALVTLIGFGLGLATGRLMRGVAPFDLDLLGTIVTTSIMVGLAVLAWWPILGKSLSKKGILW